MCVWHYILSSSRSWYLIISSGNSISTSPAIFWGRMLKTWHCGSFHSSVGTAPTGICCYTPDPHVFWQGQEEGGLWHPLPPLLNSSLHLFVTNAQQSAVILEVMFWEGIYKSIGHWHKSWETFASAEDIALGKSWGRLVWLGRVISAISFAKRPCLQWRSSVPQHATNKPHRTQRTMS